LSEQSTFVLKKALKTCFVARKHGWADYRDKADAVVIGRSKVYQTDPVFKLQIYILDKKGQGY
jgi:hypothetical protein